MVDHSVTVNLHIKGSNPATGWYEKKMVKKKVIQIVGSSAV
jgi:hypothetical protein